MPRTHGRLLALEVLGLRDVRKRDLCFGNSATGERLALEHLVEDAEHRHCLLPLESAAVPDEIVTVFHDLLVGESRGKALGDVFCYRSELRGVLVVLVLQVREEQAVDGELPGRHGGQDSFGRIIAFLDCRFHRDDHLPASMELLGSEATNLVPGLSKQPDRAARQPLHGRIKAKSVFGASPNGEMPDAVCVVQALCLVHIADDAHASQVPDVVERVGVQVGQELQPTTLCAHSTVLLEPLLRRLHLRSTV